MSIQVSLAKISSMLQKMKIGLKTDIRPFCTKAFNYDPCFNYLSHKTEFCLACTYLPIAFKMETEILWNY